MKRVEAGTFRMGSAEHYAEEAPVREVALPEFAISPYAVTNAEYARFKTAVNEGDEIAFLPPVSGG